MTDTANVLTEHNFEVTVGCDIVHDYPVTLDAAGFVWAGATFTTGILPAGSTTEHATDFTVTHPTTGTLTLALTAANTTALGVGTFRWYCTITKASVTYPGPAGQMSITGVNET